MIPSLFDFQTEVLNKNGKCLSCQEPFMYGDINWYEHASGVVVKESPNPLWIYFSCRKCDYQNALWKIEKQLGLDADYIEMQKEKMEELWNNEEDETFGEMMEREVPIQEELEDTLIPKPKPLQEEDE